MRIDFFCIPVNHGNGEAEQLNQLLSSARILTVDTVPVSITPAMCGPHIAIGTSQTIVTTIWASAASQLALLGVPKILTRQDLWNWQLVPGEITTGALVGGQMLMRLFTGGFHPQVVLPL